MENKKEELRKNSINVHQRLGTDVHVSAEEMDRERSNTRAYEYLCRLEEAKSWVGEFCSVPESFECFEEEMRKGVMLTDVCKVFAPGSVKNVFVDSTLQYRHTDNINFFLDGVRRVGLPEHFCFEVIDLYERKNFVKVVYCIHGLAHVLSSRGMCKSIRSARGKVFSEDDMARIDMQIESTPMPRFDEISKELEETVLMKDGGETVCGVGWSVETEVSELRRRAERELLEEERALMSDSSSVDEESSRVVQQTLRTFLYKKCFDDIYYRKDVSLFSIRRFVFIFFSNSVEMVKENAIEGLHQKIGRKFESIYSKEAQIKDIENRIRLIIQNRMEVGRIRMKSPIAEESDTKDFEKVLLFLQSNPKYLCGLLSVAEDVDTFIVSVVVPIFSNVCSKREEYMFVNLVLEMFRRELLSDGFEIRRITPVDSSLGVNVNTVFSLELFKETELPIQHGLMQNSICHKLMVNYFRISRGSFQLRDGMLQIVRNLENIEVDSNPSAIYEGLFKQSVSVDKALENERVRETVQTRLMVMRGVVASVLDFLESSVESLPYIFRYFMKLYGTSTFYTEFIMPFVLAPDAFIESFTVSRSLRNKCFIVSKVLGYVTDECTEFEDSSGGCEGGGSGETPGQEGERRMFELRFYSPLYPFFRKCREKYRGVMERLLDISTLDHYFQFESMNEPGRLKRSTVYLPSATVNQLIVLLLENAGILDSELLRVLETLPLFPDEQNKTLVFTFSGPEWLCPQDPERVALDNFIRMLKRKLIYAISICKGRNLVEMLMREVSEDERLVYTEMVRRTEHGKEESEDASAASPPAQYDTIDQLKESIIDDLNFLEDKKITSRHGLYSELLFMLAQDIVVLRFMSEERSKELRINELSYDNLCYRDEHLSAKIELYQNYLNSFVAKLAAKKRLFFSFTDSTGNAKDSRYGTYRYTAERLMSMGVLVQIYDSPDISEIFFLFISDAPLLLSVEVYVQNILVSHPVSFRFDDLLKLKKNGNSVCDIAGICSFNVCKFVDLVNAKYVAGDSH